MNSWKIKRSRKAGVIPNVNQFPDSETAIWNQADGKLWGLRIDESGDRNVVLIGGGINIIGEVHARLHAIDSSGDHAPVPGRILIGNPGDDLATPSCINIDNVKVMLEQIVNVSADPDNINFHIAGQVTPISVSFASIDHDKLKNFDPLRHTRMEYNDALKSYLVEH